MMKKLLLLLFIIPFFASAQKTTGNNYTYIAQRYEWLAGVFKALGLPAGDSAQFQTGQEQRAGAVYYDSTGADAGLYVWNGLAWVKAGIGSYTASQGVTLSGNDIQLGSSRTNRESFTNTRIIDVGDSSLYFIKSNNAALNDGDGSAYHSPIMGEFIDSMTANDMSSANLPKFGTTMSRRLRITGPYGSQFKVGHRQALVYEFGDSARILSAGGDFGGAVQNILYLEYLPSFTAGRTGIGGMPTQGEASYATLSMVETPSSNASRNLRVNGWLAAHTSYLRMENWPDTIDNFIFYNVNSFVESPAKVLNNYGIYFRGLPSVYNSWSVYSPDTYNKMFHAGAVAIGDSALESSALLDISSTSKGALFPRMTGAQQNAITSPVAGLMIYNTDSLAYCFYNGSAWLKMGTGSGGGTPNLQQVLDAGSALTSSETITLAGNALAINGTATTATFNPGTAALALTNSNNAGLSVSTTYTGTGNFFSRLATSDDPPVASFKNTTAGTNTAARVLSLGRASTGTPTDGLGADLVFSLETAGTGAAEDITAGRLRYKFSTVDHPTRTSQIDIVGIDNADEKIFMNIQKDLVRINDNADTLATRAYARSVGGGGGGATWGAITGTLSDQTDLQDALDLKANSASPTFTGTITTPLTANRAVVTGASSELASSATTNTELGYVSGVTSAIQTQLNNKWDLTGNAGTTAGTNYIGTRDAVDFVIKTNDTERAKFVNSTGALLLGNNAAGATNVSLQVYKATNPVLSLYNGTQFTNIFTGSAASIFQFPGGGKFGIQAASTINDAGATGLYPLLAYGSTNSYSVIIGGVALSTTPTAVLDVRGTGRFSGNLNLGTAGTTQGNLLINGSTSGTITLTTPAAAGTNTITLPAVTGTVGILSATQTWTAPNTFNGGIVGTATNDNATAGNIGEYVSSLVASGSAVSLTTATSANVTSMSLTAGDWDVEGMVNYSETTATVTARSAGTTSTSATVPTDGSEGYNGNQSITTSEINTITVSRKRFSLSGTTTVYLVASATFSAGTVAAFGNITARRIR